ncbi:hypothetical protein RHSIM_Rhsim05G0023000 [Rhododendron simsii]|uniref:F-box domain-containing protein n=1 Tax=Rhododendron simsii TaxID=118357 RepID=A0A834H0L5_RHOSS|nr:hypothetical protein RHSIM_Rhsim05G0023000 [Rhododendron simsii]
MIQMAAVVDTEKILGVDTMEETWSCIPNLLIWMIMKRLQCIDNLHLSAVCKHWLNAFHDFPKEEQIPPMSSCNFPWLMVTKDHRGSEREFFSPWTKTKFTVDLPEFAQTFVIDSKNGLLLLLTCDCCEQVQRLFLLNPFTQVKLELPRRPPHLRVNLSAISMLEGTPNCVALAGSYCPGHIAIAHPSDDAWKISTIPFDTHQYIVHMFFVDHYLYLIDNYARALRFNTIDFTMTNGFKGEKVNKFGTEEKGKYFLQCNKEIIKVSSTGLIPYGRFCMNGFTKAAWGFYKYSFSKAAWEPLDDDEIRGKSWILSNCGAKFASAVEGTPVEKVHFLSKLKKKGKGSYCLFSCDLNSPGKDANSYFGNLGKKRTVWINMA